MAKYHVGGKKWLKGNEKRGENAYFSPKWKKYTYFFPNWLKIYKIAQKMPDIFFACGAHPLIVSNFIWGKNINQQGVGLGQKYEFQI